MIPEVTNEDVLNVSRYVKLAPRGNIFGAVEINEREEWILTVMRFVLRREGFWKEVDEHRFYLVPASDIQKATFLDFINLLKYYAFRDQEELGEKELNVFLRNCTKEMQIFYLDILSKQKYLLKWFLHIRLKDLFRYAVTPFFPKRREIVGKMSRDKGKRGQREFKALLQERDWTFMESRAGAEEEDLLAISPDGRTYAVEVKNCISINQTAFLKQAKEQAQKRGKHVGWMLAAAIYGRNHTFLVQTATECEVWRLEGSHAS